MQKKRKIILATLLITLDLFLIMLLYNQIVEATGGAFSFSKHGGATGNGVVRKQWTTDPASSSDVYPSSVYAAGECSQCHEPHASYGGDEPFPNSTTYPNIMTSTEAEGPDPYLLFANNNANLCWTCHETFSFTGKPLGWGREGFYQGRTVYQASKHYTSASMLSPAYSGTIIHPRKGRPVTIGEASQTGICLNCHSPHGIKEDSASPYDTTAVPTTPTNLHLAVNNPSVTTDYVIPRQLIAWEEALCENCHDGTTENGTIPNIQAEINKRGLIGGSGHPVDDTTLSGRHVVNEAIPITTKHVECYDCHNPHAAKAGTNTPGDGDAGRVKGMKYIDIGGITRDPAAGDREPYIHEVCFKCHGNSYNQVFSGNAYPDSTTIRAKSDGATPDSRSNKRLEFDPNGTDATYGPNQAYNSAYHPVAQYGRNTTVALCLQLQGAFPTLNCTSAANAKTSLQSLTINCTDCHNTEAASAVSGGVTESSLRTADDPSNYIGASPVGPHGSQITTPALSFNGTSDNGDRSILRDYYFTGTLLTTARPFNAPANDTEFQNRFKLCFNCHDWNTFRGNNNNTNFYRSGMGPDNLHAYHLRAIGAGMQWAATYEACMTCHYNIHSNVQATNTGYNAATGGTGNLSPDGDTHLVNFAPSVVTPRDYTKPAWYYDGANMSCNLRCHTADMNYDYLCSHSATSNGVTTNTCSDN